MAIKSQTATLEIAGSASPAVFGTVGQIRSMAGPDGEASEIDVSHLGSARREFLMGLADEGSVQCEGFYDSADTDGQIEMRAARDDQDVRSFRITLSSGEVLAFQAFVMSFAISQAVDEAVTFSSRLRITGAVSYE